MYAPQDIVWPGEALKPPEGLPEKRFIRASFLEEDPYVMLSPPSTCDSTKGVLCYMVDPADLAPGMNITEEAAKLNSSVLRCCSGFCVDLLNKFSSDLHFDFHMVRVKDGKWGGVENGKWNGLVAELINKEADIVMTSVKINSGREKVIDFSVPFLEVEKVFPLITTSVQSIPNSSIRRPESRYWWQSGRASSHRLPSWSPLTLTAGCSSCSSRFKWQRGAYSSSSGSRPPDMICRYVRTHAIRVMPCQRNHKRV